MSKITQEDIKKWEADRVELLNTPDQLKKRVIQEVSGAANFLNMMTCETCLFSSQCDGHEYSPHCMNPSAQFLDPTAEAEKYYSFLMDRRWEEDVKE